MAYQQMALNEALVRSKELWATYKSYFEILRNLHNLKLDW